MHAVVATMSMALAMRVPTDSLLEDTDSLSLISTISEIVQEISTGSLARRFESGSSKEHDRLER